MKLENYQYFQFIKICNLKEQTKKIKLCYQQNLLCNLNTWAKITKFICHLTSYGKNFTILPIVKMIKSCGISYSCLLQFVCTTFSHLFSMLFLMFKGCWHVHVLKFKTKQQNASNFYKHTFSNNKLFLL